MPALATHCVRYWKCTDGKELHPKSNELTVSGLLRERKGNREGERGEYSIVWH